MRIVAHAWIPHQPTNLAHNWPHLSQSHHTLTFNPNPSFYLTPPINKPPPPPIFLKLKAIEVLRFLKYTLSLSSTNTLYKYFFSKTSILIYIYIYTQGFSYTSFCSSNQALSHHFSSSTTTILPPEGLPKFVRVLIVLPNLRRIFPANFPIVLVSGYIFSFINPCLNRPFYLYKSSLLSSIYSLQKLFISYL